MITGSLVAIVTPTLKDGGLDLPRFRKLRILRRTFEVKPDFSVAGHLMRRPPQPQSRFF